MRTWKPCHIIFFAVCALLSAGVNSQTEFEFLSSENTGIDFINRINEVPGRNIGSYDYFYNGGGVAIADLNADGRPDIFFTGNDASCELYLNQGNLQFEKVTDQAGLRTDVWCTGVTVADVNRDGHPDLYVSVSGPDYKDRPTRNLLFINDGKAHFKESAAEYGIDDNGLSTQGVFFDMDKDGDLDLWVINHAVRNLANATIDWIAKVRNLPLEEQRRFCNSLYRNDNGRFVDVSAENNLLAPGFGLGIAVSDLNGDSWPDVYITNDYFITDQLYLNDGKGGFRESIKEKLDHSSFYSMGVDAADINNDGWMDLIVPDMTPSDHYRSKMMMNSMNVPEFDFMVKDLKFLPQYMFNTLQLNNGDAIMSEIGQAAGIHQSDWSWAPLLMDLDHDGMRDLFISTGIRRDVKNNDWRLRLLEMMRSGSLNAESYYKLLLEAPETPLNNYVFRNIDGLQFQLSTVDWKLENPSFSNGAAYGDLDGDGDLDLVVNNIDSEAFIMKNKLSTEDRHWLRLDLSAVKGKVLEGTQIQAFANGEVFAAEYAFTRGFQSFMEPVVHLGLGQNESIDSLKIGWNDGSVTVLKDVRADQVLSTIAQGMDSAEPVSAHSLEPAVKPFEDASEQIKPFFVHQENDFNDFGKEILLPHRMSTLGPGMAVGDVNGDGLEDAFIGGAKGQRSVLLVQYGDALFRQQFIEDGPYRWSEVLGAAFFDADGDGDLDLYVAHGGGGDFENSPELLQDVLYLNNLGQFSPSPDALPEMRFSSEVVVPLDVDGDGDLDLFVGGRNVPGRYPQSPPSVLLINRKGVFTEEPAWKANSSQIGMITSALPFDWDDDGVDELVAVGEWTGIQVYEIANGTLERVSGASETEHRGWWWSLQKADLNGDGKQDLILGNLGKNNKFKPSVKKPLHVFANDMDGNGSFDIVLSKYYKERLVPVRGRECSSMQMPFILDQFPNYDSFASSALIQIYPEENLNTAVHDSVNTFSSMIALNKGQGSFEFIELPFEAQLSPIMGSVVMDLDQDGHQDLLLAGNYARTEVETAPYDAGKGVVLYGDGTGQFVSGGSYHQTGFLAKGDVRAMKEVRTADKSAHYFLVPVNDGRLRMIRFSLNVP